MAYEIPGFSFSLPAAADYSAEQYKFVKINTSGQAVLVAALGVDVTGVLVNDPAAAGRPATVVTSGVVKVYAGATVTVGAKVVADATGRAIIADGPKAIGTFLTAGAVGEVVSILLEPRGEADLNNPDSHNVETLAGTKTLVITDAKYQALDPGGAGRDVVLPAVALSRGAVFHILNKADAAETLTVKNAAAATILAVLQNKAAVFVCDGATWIHMGLQTIALA